MVSIRNRKRWHNGAAWLLVAGILLQPIINYLVTPWVSLDSRGHYVLMCTLNGLQQVLVEEPGTAAPVEDEAPCPALDLFKLVGSAKPVAAFELPSVVLRAVRTLTPTAVNQTSRDTETNYAIRAPPIA